MHRDGRFFFRAVYLQNKPHQKVIDHQNKLIQDLLSRIGGNTFKQSLAEQVYSLSYPVFWAATQLKVEVLRRLEKTLIKNCVNLFLLQYALDDADFPCQWNCVIVSLPFAKKTAPHRSEANNEIQRFKNDILQDL